MRHTKRLFSSFKAADLQIQLTQRLLTKPAFDKTLKFGRAKTDHMLEIDFLESEGWRAPSIAPYHNIVIDPRSSCLHYGIQCFEGMKAYKDSRGRVLMFRPEMNMARLAASAAVLSLPAFDRKELLECICELVKTERDWVPALKDFSLYIRPTYIGISNVMGVHRAESAKLFTVLAPVGPYFPTGFAPTALYCDENLVRAWPGGVGNVKVGGNYAPGILPTENINKLKYNQLLWLVSEH
jgi:branched-chain amino acid aminotransferase